MRSDQELQTIFDQLVAAHLETIPDNEAADRFLEIAGDLTGKELDRIAELERQRA